MKTSIAVVVAILLAGCAASNSLETYTTWSNVEKMQGKSVILQAQPTSPKQLGYVTFGCSVKEVTASSITVDLWPNANLPNILKKTVAGQIIATDGTQITFRRGAIRAIASAEKENSRLFYVRKDVFKEVFNTPISVPASRQSEVAY